MNGLIERGYRLNTYCNIEFWDRLGELQNRYLDILDGALTVWCNRIRDEYLHTNDNELANQFTFDSYKQYLFDESSIDITSFADGNAIHINWYDDGCNVNMIVLNAFEDDIDTLYFHSSDCSSFDQIERT